MLVKGATGHSWPVSANISVVAAQNVKQIHFVILITAYRRHIVMVNDLAMTYFISTRIFETWLRITLSHQRFFFCLVSNEDK